MSPTPGRRALWILPIVFAVCAVMVLPGTAILGPNHVGGSSATGASAPVSTASAASARAGTMNSPLSTTFGDTGRSYSPQTPSPSALSSATTLSQYSSDLTKIASNPSLGDGTAISALASDIAAGKVSPASVYLPNLNLLETGPRSPGQGIGSGYAAEPAPMGIGDIGIGGGVVGTPYSYNTSHFAGSLTLDSANATYPGAPYFVTPPYNDDGSYNTPYEFGIQLNTVTNNISIPGNNASSWWTQNVVALNGNILQFEDNVWNFSSPSGAFNPGSILYGNGVSVYPSFYYDYANESIPLSFPVTINLYNNLSVVNLEDVMTFGYRVVDSYGVFSGWYDRVVFNNPWAADGLAPANPPTFEVSGYYTSPLGLNYDAELIFGGPGGGSNAVFNNISGTESLQYSNVTSGGWKSVPSAYDFGSDTGETAIGVAETWSPGGTVGLSAGPSFLYGLWNSKASTAVPSGKMQFQGEMTPSYGFMFMDPGVMSYLNTSWLPTNAAGQFNTYLPPGTYDWYSLADGYARTFGTITSSTTGFVEHLSADIAYQDAPLYVNGNSQAQAAATAVAGWTSGPLAFNGLTFLWSSTDTDPLFFDHLNDWGYVSWNLFQATGVTDVLNVSNLEQGNNNVSGVGTNIYFMDGAPIGSGPTLLGIPPQATYSLQYYGSEIALYQDTHVQIYGQYNYGYFAGSNLTSGTPYYALDPAGGGDILWGDAGASVQGVISVDGSYGAYIAGSNNVYANDNIGGLGANGLGIVGSAGAVVNQTYGIGSVLWSNSESLSGAAEVPFGAYVLYSPGGVYTNTTALGGGVGIADFYSSGTVINNVMSEVESPNVTGSIFTYAIGVLLNGASGVSINDTFAEDVGIGVADGIYGSGSYGTVITNLTNDNDGAGVVLDYSSYTTITNWFDENTNIGGALEGADNTTITDLSIFDAGTGLILESLYNGYSTAYTDNTTFQSTTIFLVDTGIEAYDAFTTTFLNTNVSDAEVDGLFLEDAWDTTVTNFNTTDSLQGAVLESVWGVSLTNIVGWNTVAFFIEYGEFVTATQVTAWFIYGYALTVEYGESINVTASTTLGDSGIVDLEYVSGAVVSGLTVTDGSIGLLAQDSEYITASGVSATGDSLGVVLDDCDYSTVTDATSADPSIAVGVYESYWSTVSDVTSTAQGLGVQVVDSEFTWISSVSVTNMSTGVFSIDSEYTAVSGVTATNTTLSTPNAAGTLEYDGYDLPATGAIVTEDDYQDSISDVTATTYPLAFYDENSEYTGVNNLNSTGGYIGVYLDGTEWGTFTNLGLFGNLVGLEAYADAEYNVVTMSSFVDNTLYGVYLDGAYDNYIWENSFIGNNGAGSSYSAAHIQAFTSDDDNYFYFEGVGNYWSDWHTYNQYGDLAPYPLGGINFDYYPLGGPEGTFPVWFYDNGLASGVSWSVTFNGATQSTTNDYLVFYALPGTYSFTAGAVSGYTISPSTGSVTVSTAEQSVDIYYSGSTMVTVTESGLPAGASWTAIVGGASATGNTSSLSVGASAGTWNFQVVGPAGYSASPSSGTITVGTTSYALAVSFTQVTYAVTVSESGLSTGTSWSATINGATQSSTGTSITFYLANGTYTATIGSVSGYSASSSSVPVTVNGNPSGASVSFSSNSSTSLVSSSTFNTWLAVAIAIAVIALIIGLVALMGRKKNSSNASEPPAAWTPPAAAGGSAGSAGGAGAGSAGTTGGSSGAWSESSGPGTPPSS